MALCILKRHGGSVVANVSFLERSLNPFNYIEGCSGLLISALCLKIAWGIRTFSDSERRSRRVARVSKLAQYIEFSLNRHNALIWFDLMRSIH